MAVNNERLISEVEKRPALWQAQCKDYKDTKKKSAIWCELGDLLLPGDKDRVDKVQKRWRSLRDKLVRLLRDMKKTRTSGAGADDVEDPMAWPHFEQMYFVKDSLEHRSTSGNMKTSTNDDFIRPVEEGTCLDESAATDGPEPVACIVVVEVDEECHSGGVGSPFPPAFTSDASNEP
uniref:Putative alcohol dehydrogenase transcription factor myb/sant like protein n=1 Tax=Ixodes ricinus TaxID=34613 RepID=A0A6B0UZI5_IXORI